MPSRSLCAPQQHCGIEILREFHDRNPEIRWLRHSKSGNLNESSNQDRPNSTSPDDAIIGRALRISLCVFTAAVLLGAIVIAAGRYWNRDQPPETVAGPIRLPEVRQVSEVPIPSLPFTDITREAGIEFQHENGAAGEKLLPETMGSGCAFFDYDNDGDQDLLLVNGCRWPWDARSNASTSHCVLYQNDGSGHFRDVSDESGLADFELYGTGVAVGDFDNDGHVDLFLAAVGSNRLLRNEKGRFVDVTQAMGIGGAADQWSSSAAWIDYDNDGDLDLLVCNYIRWSRGIDLQQEFQLTGIGRAYGPPISFEGAQPYLYRNDGERFTDVSATSGIQQRNTSTGVALAKSLAVAPVDADRDGWIDLIVANDTVRNLFFRNEHDGTFQEMAMEAGIAFDPQGKARGAMGIDAGYFRNDDCLGVAIANFANEMTALYVCEGANLLFTDDAIPTGLGPPTRLDLSFGLLFVDVDLDGRLDLVSANGHLENDIHLVQASQQYRQPARLFWNAGPASPSEFVAVPPAKLGRDFCQPIVGRGASTADIDGDGDLDLLLTQTGASPLLLRNDQELKHDFLRFRLIGQTANRDAIGAWVEVQANGRTLRRQVMPTRSYLSQSELPVTFGLGDGIAPDRVVVQWPNGTEQVIDDYRINGLTVVQQR